MHNPLQHITCLLIITFLSLAFSLPNVHAGIVNVQSSLATEPAEGLSGSVTGSVDWRTGNLTRLLFSLAPVARYRAGSHSIIGLVSVDYFRDSRLLRVFNHLRYRNTLTKRLLGEVFIQHERNDKRLLGIRVVAGAGARYQLVESKKLRVGLGVAYMFEYERLQNQGADFQLILPETRETDNHRVSSYLTGSYEMADNLQIVQTLYAQPLMSKLSDIRLLSDSVLVVRVTKSVSFKTTLSLAYDSIPPEYDYVGALPPDEAPTPPSVKAFDSVLQGSITYDF